VYKAGCPMHAAEFALRVHDFEPGDLDSRFPPGNQLQRRSLMPRMITYCPVE
jgi:hypothetical protein